MRSLRFTAQNLLKRVHLYERVKASCLYDLYWTIADQKIISSRDQEVELYRNVLEGFRGGDLIFDIGANKGFKTEIFLRLGATVIAVDPDEVNQAALKEKFLKYRMVKKPVLIVGKAVSDKNGFNTFWVDEPGSAKNTLSEKWVDTLRRDEKHFGKLLSFPRSVRVDAITLEDLVQTYGRPFFIKIDVEGHEFNVLSGLRRPVPYLSFEVNLPEFRSEGLKCIERLDQLAPRGLFNYIIGNHPKLASDWMNAEGFRDVLQRCAEDSIEVFWKTLNRPT
jgi:FkbM family methyltransferase